VQILVKTLYGITIEEWLEPWADVSLLRERVSRALFAADIKGSDPGSVHFHHNSIFLIDGFTLEDYGLQSGSTLYLIHSEKRT
jgi:hypothetical protein